MHLIQITKYEMLILLCNTNMKWEKVKHNFKGFD